MMTRVAECGEGVVRLAQCRARTVYVACREPGFAESVKRAAVAACEARRAVAERVGPGVDGEAAEMMAR